MRVGLKGEYFNNKKGLALSPTLSSSCLLEAASFQGTLISSNRSSLGVGNDAQVVLRYQTALALLAV